MPSEQYKKLIRDAFIIDCVSHGERQRLLENSELDLENAVVKVRAMELAQENSNFYFSIPQSRINLAASATANVCNDENVSKDFLLSVSVNKPETTSCVNKLCSFCERAYHLRNWCPARNATCYKCQEKTHFANVCWSKPTKNTNACMFSSMLCVVHETSDCLTRASLIGQIMDTKVFASINTSRLMSQ